MLPFCNFFESRNYNPIPLKDTQDGLKTQYGPKRKMCVKLRMKTLNALFRKFNLKSSWSTFGIEIYNTCFGKDMKYLVTESLILKS